MKRRYAVLRVEEWQKRAHGDTTLNLLHTDGFHRSDGIRTDHGEYIHVDTPDDQVLQQGKYYLMTLEELPSMPIATGGNPRPYEEFINERRLKDDGVIVPVTGRLFRGTKS